MDFPGDHRQQDGGAPSVGSFQAATPGRFGRGWIPAGRDIGLPGEADGPPLPPVRHDGWTPERKVHFLGRLADEGNVRAACAAVGLSPEAAYRLRRRDALFAEAWAAALVAARAHAEQILATRALHGSEEQVWFRGELVGVRRRHDGRLLLAHLARLDRMAEETAAGLRAARFDEVLALVAGETFAPDMADREGAGHFDPDPLLPMDRERYVEAAGREGALEVWGETIEALMEGAVAASRAPEDWHSSSSPEIWLSDEERAELEEAEDLGDERGRIAGAAAWDAWRARAARVADGCAQDAAGPGEPGSGAGGELVSGAEAALPAEGAADAAAGLPVEYKSCAGPGFADCSLDTINSVNFAAVMVGPAEGRPASGGAGSGFTGCAGGRILRENDAGECKCPRQCPRRQTRRSRPARPASSPTSSACGKGRRAFPARSGAGSPPAPCGKTTG